MLHIFKQIPLENPQTEADVKAVNPLLNLDYYPLTALADGGALINEQGCK